MQKYFLNTNVIRNHELFKAANNNIFFISSFIDPETGITIDRELTDKENLLMDYCTPIDNVLTGLANVYTEIIYVENILSTFNSTSKQIGEDDELYLTYHYKNWILRLISLLDINSHLINTIFDLGYKNVGYYEILKNTHILKEKQLTTTLKTLNNLLETKITFHPQGIRATRNSLVHAGEFYHDLITEASMNHFFNLELNGDGIIKDYHYASMESYKMIQEINTKCSALQIKILSLLLTSYKKRIAQIESRTNDINI